MLPQDDRAAPPACAQGTPTPNENIVQRAHGWNAKRKEKAGATGAARNRAQSDLRTAEQKLAEACDRALAKGGGES